MTATATATVPTARFRFSDDGTLLSNPIGAQVLDPARRLVVDVVDVVMIEPTEAEQIKVARTLACLGTADARRVAAEARARCWILKTRRFNGEAGPDIPAADARALVRR